MKEEPGMALAAATDYVMGAVNCFPNYIVLPTVIRMAGKSSKWLPRDLQQGHP